MIRSLCTLAVSFTTLSSLVFADAKSDWRGWRGPNGNGVATDGQSPPTEWSETKNVLWKVRVPGRGHSSPTVVGDKVVLTTADEARQVQSVVCFDRKTGKQLWKTDINTGGFPRRIHRKNTHATPTVASNGKLLFAAFNNNASVQLAALDMDGNVLWKKAAGDFQPKRYHYGYAPSPLVDNDLVIVSAESPAAGFLAAFDQKTGRERWRATRKAQTSYSSPIVAKIGGKNQLLISGDKKISVYDPATGKTLWEAASVCTVTCGTMVWNDGLVFASGGYPQRGTIAMKADGSGKIVWQHPVKCYEQSLLAHDGHVYAVADGGVAYCWNAADGTLKWRARLGGDVSASPVLANGHIYAANERGTFFVFKANPEKFELAAKNQLGDSSFATPTICGGMIFLRVRVGTARRGSDWLYCIAKE